MIKFIASPVVGLTIGSAGNGGVGGGVGAGANSATNGINGNVGASGNFTKLEYGGGSIIANGGSKGNGGGGGVGSGWNTDSWGAWDWYCTGYSGGAGGVAVYGGTVQINMPSGSVVTSLRGNSSFNGNNGTSGNGYSTNQYGGYGGGGAGGPAVSVAAGGGGQGGNGGNSTSTKNTASGGCCRRRRLCWRYNHHLARTPPYKHTEDGNGRTGGRSNVRTNQWYSDNI